MFISPTTQQIKPTTEEFLPTSDNLEEFWYYYFSIIFLAKRYTASPFVISLLSYLMTKNAAESHFHKHLRQELLVHLGRVSSKKRVSSNDLTSPVKFLTELGFLQKEGQGLIYLSPGLQKLKAYIDEKVLKGDSLNLLLHFKFKNDDY